MEWIQIRNFLYPDKKHFLHFYRHANQFYDRYLNLANRKNYIDNDCSGEKPKLEIIRRHVRYPGYDPIQSMLDRNFKWQDRILVEKENQLGAFFYLVQDSVTQKATRK